MRQIKDAPTIPQIYNTTIIIGACRWNDAHMDMNRLTKLGRRQTWLSPQRAEGFVQTYSSEMIGRILLHIRNACDLAKETYLPTEILVILYGFGNPRGRIRL
ncbi:hypothetical protein NOF04DRAFT_1363753 [Fusarium oxysporum II5]|nr:hypothetical protein NOF04DRAFT_1363753 [Fusarium oxysporum II5]